MRLKRYFHWLIFSFIRIVVIQNKRQRVNFTFNSIIVMTYLSRIITDIRVITTIEKKNA